MRINLECPFAEKDRAKAAGAKWDPAARCWYVVDAEDLAPFVRWLPRRGSASRENPGNLTVTLSEYLRERYGDHAASLTMAAAVAFGVPYPLERGWAKAYAAKTASAEALGKIKKVKTSKARPARKDSHAPKTTGGKFVPLCQCTTPPWEHCQHSEALAAKKAMDQIAQAKTVSQQ